MLPAGPRGVPPYAYHKILDVDEQTNQNEITKKYHKLAKKYHPDKNSGCVHAEEKFKCIVSAYDVLKDVDSRELYERECKNWIQFGPPKPHYPTKKQEKKDFHITTTIVCDVIPEILFSKSLTGLQVQSFSMIASFFGVVAYDFYTYPILYTIFGSTAMLFTPSLFLVPFISTGVSFALSPLFCDRFTEYLSYTSGMFSICFPETYFWTYLFIQGFFSDINLSEKEKHVLKQFVDVCVEYSQNALISIPQNIISITQSAIEYSANTTKYCFDKVMASILDSFSKLTITNNTTRIEKDIGDISDWVLVDYEDSNDFEDETVFETNNPVLETTTSESKGLLSYIW